MADVTIPKGTPFILTGRATDAEGDQLQYNWEQVDNASLTIRKDNLGVTTSGASFRSRVVSACAYKVFPDVQPGYERRVAQPG